MNDEYLLRFSQYEYTSEEYLGSDVIAVEQIRMLG